MIERNQLKPFLSMYPLNLDASTPEIATRSERREAYLVALDFDIYYNEGGMDEQATAAYDSDESEQGINDLPDYM